MLLNNYEALLICQDMIKGTSLTGKMDHCKLLQSGGERYPRDTIKSLQKQSRERT